MDHSGVDVTGAPGASEGDEVVIIGRQGDDEITADDLARKVGTISYEILCGLSERVPRHYIHNGELIEVCNLLGCSPTRERPRQMKDLSR